MFATGSTKADGGHVIVDRVASCSLAANSSAQAAAVNPNAHGNQTINQVQRAVNKAQAAYAGVTESQTALQRAQIDTIKSLLPA